MEIPVSPEVRVFPDREALSTAAAREIQRVVEDAIASTDRCAIALAGGSTPRWLYEVLARDYHAAIPWSNVHLFWGDERCVRPDHKASNVRMAREALIDHLGVPEVNVHAPTIEAGSPEDAAAGYEHELRAHFQHPSDVQQGWPVFDLVLLGVGADGHTASLFPGSEALDAGDRWVVASQAPPDVDVRDRITLTMPVINRARAAFVIATGESKRPVVREILETPKTAVLRYPSAQVHPKGRLVWWVDRAAIGLEGKPT